MFEAALDKVRRRHPPFVAAVLADAKLLARSRQERAKFHGRLDAAVQVLRLMWETDAFAGLVCYRAKASLQARHVPVLPRLLHHIAIAKAQVCIGDTVWM